MTGAGGAVWTMRPSLDGAHKETTVNNNTNPMLDVNTMLAIEHVIGAESRAGRGIPVAPQRTVQAAAFGRAIGRRHPGLSHEVRAFERDGVIVATRAGVAVLVTGSALADAVRLVALTAAATDGRDFLAEAVYMENGGGP
mgnify:CR=1 FL=1